MALTLQAPAPKPLPPVERPPWLPMALPPSEVAPLPAVPAPVLSFWPERPRAIANARRTGGEALSGFGVGAPV